MGDRDGGLGGGWEEGREESEPQLMLRGTGPGGSGTHLSTLPQGGRGGDGKKADIVTLS